MSERRPWRGDGSRLEMLRTLHFRLENDNTLVPLFRGVPMLPTSTVSLAAVRDGIVAAGEWYLANLQPNGQVTYKVWPSENRYSNEYNFVRHTLATWNLTQAYMLDPRPEFLDGARQALAFTNAHYKREDVTAACEKAEWCTPSNLDVTGQMAYYTYNNNQKLGSVVANMLGMIELARVTGSHEREAHLTQMGHFGKSMQKDDGAFHG